jgi:hypothetical protein
MYLGLGHDPDEPRAAYLIANQLLDQPQLRSVQLHERLHRPFHVREPPRHRCHHRPLLPQQRLVLFKLSLVLVELLHYNLLPLQHTSQLFLHCRQPGLRARGREQFGLVQRFYCRLESVQRILLEALVDEANERLGVAFLPQLGNRHWCSERKILRNVANCSLEY